MNTKETQITPGTWEVSMHGTPEAFPQCGIYAEGSQNDHVIVKGDTWEQARANANAISALPELLAACLRVVECGEKEPDNTCAACVKLARAAIAKARGQ